MPFLRYKMQKPLLAFITHLCMTLLLSGCSYVSVLSPEERDRSAQQDLNAAFENKVGYDEAYQEKTVIPQHKGWWTMYDDAQLNTLMNYAFANSPTIAQTYFRLKRSEAVLAQSKSSLLPKLNASAQRGDQTGDNRAPSDFTLSGAASYEVDIWGKNAARVQSDTLALEASKQDLQAAYITLSASIVENWLRLLSLIEQEKLARKQIEVNTTVLELQQKRFEMGTASALDILQQKEILAQSESRIPDILSDQKQTANAIAYLLGSISREGLQVSEKPLPAPLPLPDAGLPSSLLIQRPDIQAAWLRVLSSDWASEAAWANRLPQFNLSLSVATTATALAGLFETWLLDMAASVSDTVFDGGAQKAAELQQRALADEAYHAYKEVVLLAVKDVEDALVRNVYQDKKLTSIQKQLDAAYATLEQAQTTYINGQSSYINVLNSLNNTQSLEQQLVQEKLAQSLERVSVYRALGGQNWTKGLARANVLSSKQGETIDHE